MRHRKYYFPLSNRVAFPLVLRLHLRAPRGSSGYKNVSWETQGHLPDWAQFRDSRLAWRTPWDVYSPGVEALSLWSCDFSETFIYKKASTLWNQCGTENEDKIMVSNLMLRSGDLSRAKPTPSCTSNSVWVMDGTVGGSFSFVWVLAMSGNIPCGVYSTTQMQVLRSF